jgi:phosphate transport system substrate-binding protein
MGKSRHTIRRLGLVCALCIASWVLPGCGGVEPSKAVYLRAAGSTAAMPLVEKLAKAYAQNQPNVTIEVSGGGSRLGLEQVRGGEVDIGLVSWLAEGQAESLQATVIARDGLALVVHPDNKLRGLTLLQARELFAGRVLYWGEIGGTGGEVQIISREDGSGDREAFETLVMGSRRVTPNAIVMPSSQAVVEYVAAHSNAIGYVSMEYADSSVRVLEVEGLAPTPENVSSGEYHLTRNLTLLTRPEAPPEVKAFVRFALSPQGQTVVGANYGRVR